MTKENHRVHIVRPSNEFAEASLNLMHDDNNGNGEEKFEKNDGEPASWDDMAKKFEELETRLAEQFENNGEDNREAPPMIRAPEKKNQHQRNGHDTRQHTHTTRRMVPTLHGSKKCTETTPISWKKG